VLSEAKIIISFGCHPLNGVTLGGPSLPHPLLPPVTLLVKTVVYYGEAIASYVVSSLQRRINHLSLETRLAKTTRSHKAT